MAFLKVLRRLAVVLTTALSAAYGQGTGSSMVWSRVASTTTSALNGVAVSGSGTFVAVGDNGVLLKSSDGVAWTAEASGTAQNLYGVIAPDVISEAPLWVAVGGGGTLLTSADGATWTQRASGSTADLRAVAYSHDNSKYLAVGASGVALLSSDGVTWSVGAFKTTAQLNAVAAVPTSYGGGGFFLVVGDNGTVVFVQNAFTSVASIVSGTTTDFTSILLDVDPNAPSNSLRFLGATGMALGQAGVTGTYADTGPDLYFARWNLNPPANSANYSAAGSALINNAWYGATLTSDGSVAFESMTSPEYAASVQLPSGVRYNGIAVSSVSVVVGQGGTIWSNSTAASGGSVPSIVITGSTDQTIQFLGQTLTLAGPVVSGAVYQWYHNGNPIAGATNSSLILPDAQLSATGSYSVAVSSSTLAETLSTSLNVKPYADFSPQLVDPTFIASVADPELVNLLPNGNVLANGTQLLDHNGKQIATASFAQAENVIVQPDGKWIDTGESTSGQNPIGVTRFNADGSVDTSFSLPSALVDYSDQLALLPNGQLLLLTTPFPYRQVTWWRLNRDGSIDPSFAPQSLAVTSPEATPQGIVSPTVDGQGRIYVAVLSAPQTSDGNTLVFRLTPDLKVDPAFSVAPSTFSLLSVTQIQATPQGLLYAASNQTQGTKIGLLDSRGVPSASYHGQTIAGAGCVLEPDGSVIALVPSVSPVSPVCANVRRFDAFGEVDPDFGGRIVGDPDAGLNNGSIDGGKLRLTVAGNQFLVSNTFNSLDLVPTQGVARITPDAQFVTTHLVNASVRGSATPVQPMMMAGYLAGGPGMAAMSVPFLFRAAGPALLDFGISNAVSNPVLTVSSGQTSLGTNAGWSNGGQASAITQLGEEVGAFAFPPNSSDAAFISQLRPGPFYLQVAGGAGVALAEAYNAGLNPATPADVRVTNFSCLDTTSPGAGQLTLGFVVAGPDVKSVLIRAVGPGLSNVNLTGPNILAAPVVSLYRGQNLIASNQNINTSNFDQEQEVLAESTLVGAFPLPLLSPDSALSVALPAGAYTAVASGANGTSGTVLLEVYEVP